MLEILWGLEEGQIFSLEAFPLPLGRKFVGLWIVPLLGCIVRFPLSSMGHHGSSK